MNAERQPIRRLVAVFCCFPSCRRVCFASAHHLASGWDVCRRMPYGVPFTEHLLCAVRPGGLIMHLPAGGVWFCPREDVYRTSVCCCHHAAYLKNCSGHDERKKNGIADDYRKRAVRACLVVHHAQSGNARNKQTLRAHEGNG